jgi:NhaA family Na+:H+ antiporter
MGLASLSEPVMLGIALGLFIGKQAGIFTALWLTI